MDSKSLVKYAFFTYGGVAAVHGAACWFSPRDVFPGIIGEAGDRASHVLGFSLLALHGYLGCVAARQEPSSPLAQAVAGGAVLHCALALASSVCSCCCKKMCCDTKEKAEKAESSCCVSPCGSGWKVIPSVVTHVALIAILGMVVLRRV